MALRYRLDTGIQVKALLFISSIYNYNIITAYTDDMLQITIFFTFT